ncbi:hypothetical protein EV426DRAFT_609457 [Tirmania nivea]|nr:hypothetical protein EV426DRAFT_609457 [Tirmania nivea]
MPDLGGAPLLRLDSACLLAIEPVKIRSLPASDEQRASEIHFSSPSATVAKVPKNDPSVAPIPENIPMSGSAQELLNRKSIYLHNLGTTGEQIQAAYPAVQGQLLNARASVTHCTHAEMNVLQMLLSISPQPKEIKIGVSKRCCFLCTEFFRIVEEEYRVKILFSGHHNKVYAGWRCFEDKLLPRIKQVVDEKLEIHLDKIHRFPRFDSEPLDSEEEEIDRGLWGEIQEKYQSRIIRWRAG